MNKMKQKLCNTIKLCGVHLYFSNKRKISVILSFEFNPMVSFYMRVFNFFNVK